jgi:hypothetical protein
MEDWTLRGRTFQASHSQSQGISGCGVHVILSALVRSLQDFAALRECGTECGTREDPCVASLPRNVGVGVISGKRVRGDLAKAVEANGSLLALWKQADPEVQAVLQDVRRETAELGETD